MDIFKQRVDKREAEIQSLKKIMDELTQALKEVGVNTVFIEINGTPFFVWMEIKFPPKTQAMKVEPRTGTFKITEPCGDEEICEGHKNTVEALAYKIMRLLS